MTIAKCTLSVNIRSRLILFIVRFAHTTKKKRSLVEVVVYESVDLENDEKYRFQQFTDYIIVFSCYRCIHIHVQIYSYFKFNYIIHAEYLYCMYSTCTYFKTIKYHLYFLLLALLHDSPFILISIYV